MSRTDNLKIIGWGGGVKLEWMDYFLNKKHWNATRDCKM